MITVLLVASAGVQPVGETRGRVTAPQLGRRAAVHRRWCRNASDGWEASRHRRGTVGNRRPPSSTGQRLCGVERVRRDLSVSGGGLEPPRPVRALAPQASASAIPPPGRATCEFSSSALGPRAAIEMALGEIPATFHVDPSAAINHRPLFFLAGTNNGRTASAPRAVWTRGTTTGDPNRANRLSRGSTSDDTP
jgi:hypothetical protein